jgi:ADP-heptose:LPS heptosyltransferase
LNTTPKKILVIRFSAMGDVALCAPVIDAVLEQNPHVEITFLTRPFFEPVFKSNSRLSFHFADFKEKHKGLLGLRRLYKELKRQHFDAVVDLHDVLRTQVIRRFFSYSLPSTKTAVIEKGRKEKESIMLKKTPLRPLKHTTERYLDVFRQIGIPAQLTKRFYLEPKLTVSTPYLTELMSANFILIAPFAAHSSKEWGTQNWHSFLELFYQSAFANRVQIYLLGGGAKEQLELNNWVAKFSKLKNLTRQFSLAEELAILSKAKLVLAMDSGNMHLASLVGTKVMSIWGATHPYLGFAPLYNEEFIIQADLPCRPCSVYGVVKTAEQKKCAQHAMELVSPQEVWDNVIAILR